MCTVCLLVLIAVFGMLRLGVALPVPSREMLILGIPVSAWSAVGLW